MNRWLACCVLSICPALRAVGDDRIVVKSADDLPRHSYQVTGKSLDLIQDDARFFPLLDQMVADAEADLKKYKIEDQAALRGYYDFLQSAAMIRRDYARALEYVPKLKELETKEAERRMTGMSLAAQAAAAKAAGDDASKFAEIYKVELRKRLAEVPFDLVRDRVVQVHGQLGIVTRELIEGGLQPLDQMIAAGQGQVPFPVAAGLVQTRLALDVALPLIPHMRDVYGEYISANRDQGEQDIWTPRLAKLETSAAATPVVVAVWDSGVDTRLFPGQLWRNEREQPNGRDDDGNGFVDDLHGIAFGRAHEPVAGDCMPLDDLKSPLEECLELVQGSSEMQSGLQTPGVEAFQNRVRGLTGPQVMEFQEDMSLVGAYAHGTHVAGIVAEGNPFARLLYVRETWEHKSVPRVAPTLAEYQAWARSAQQAVDYFKQADVRVVNMSWRIPRSAVESMLAAKGVGKDDAERAALSREIFGALREGLEQAIASAPEILFVAGAGNEDNDVAFSEYVPAGLKAPNLITIGAVNAAGRPTSFTSFGQGVKLYANGQQVESFLPGGKRVRLSGTSMAAPQVANLAAKLCALRPELSVAQLIEIIEKTAEPLSEQPDRLSIHPARAVEEALQRN